MQKRCGIWIMLFGVEGDVISQDAESRLSAKTQEVGTLSAKVEAKTEKQQAETEGLCVGGMMGRSLETGQSYNVNR